MAAISGLSGLTSIDSFIDSYLKVERRPLDELESQKSDLQQQISVYSDLKTQLSSLRDQVRSFFTVGAETNLGTKQAVSSNSAIVTAEASTEAEIGIHTIFISRIASRDTVLSDRIRTDANSLARRYRYSTQRFSIKVGSNAPIEFAVSFNDRDETDGDILSRIAESINNADIGVTANVVEVNKRNVRLALVSEETGSENALTLVDKTGSSLLREIGLPEGDGERSTSTNSNGGFLQQNTENLDALFTINGIEVTQSSNTAENIIPGLTIQIRKAQEDGDQPETITVSGDSDQLKEGIKDFIEEYNTALEYINGKLNVDTVTKKRGALAGNFNIIQLRLRLREIVSQNTFAESNTTVRNLADMGVAIGRDGTLAISDEDEFDKQLAEKGTEIQALFNAESGLAKKFDTELTRFTRFGGVVSGLEKGVKSKIRNIDARSERLNSRIDTRETHLRQQYSRLYQALSSLISQQQSLQQINMNFGYSLFGGYGQQFRTTIF